MALAEFIERWTASSGAERANKDSFLLELCDILGVPRPKPTTGNPDQDTYVLEADARTTHAGGRITLGKMDLYKQGCFILEAKQGSQKGALKLGTARRDTPAWSIAMQEAFGQALHYARTLAEPPPFLIICDIGYCFDLYASFDGGPYRPYPDPQASRLFLTDLARHTEQLHQVWQDPHSLDPSRRKIRVTQEIAGHLAELARTLEQRQNPPEQVARFLMRCLFTMFAEDVGLLPQDVFKNALESHWRTYPERFVPELEALWKTMDTGGYQLGLGKIKHFNGALFADAHALPLTRPELNLLYQAASCDWQDVEPAIFGTLLERALDPSERHKLGAHYTPRPYVERLVRPTLEDPLRAEWDNVRAAALHLVNAQKEAEARKILGDFHVRLCSIRVLDPACGTGNFLYVALDTLKKLEGEVLARLQELGDSQVFFGSRINPRQFFGLELKPWAREIADLVLWVGYLNAQLKILGKGRDMNEPILEKLDNIQSRDAVLAWDDVVDLVADGALQTRWDGASMKVHPVTGKEVPDESKRIPLVKYLGARPSSWPEADFIVGNPPFLGGWKIRQARGDGYAEALRAAYPNVPDAADYVMYWWDKAAEATRLGKAQRFGFITTNSISQVFPRRVIAHHLNAEKPLRLVYAVPDHPWVDAEEAADVRIAMTVGEKDDGGFVVAERGTVRREDAAKQEVELDFELVPKLDAALRAGVSLDMALPLRSNENLAHRGVNVFGAGFVLSKEEAVLLGLGRDPSTDRHIRPYRNGRDLMAKPRGVFIIDMYGLSEKDVRTQFPDIYQRLLERVKPERDQNNRASIKNIWWRFGWERPLLRDALASLSRYITTVETAKHRIFQFLSTDILPDNKLVNIGLDSSYHLGILSSRIHIAWALAAGGRLGVGNDPIYTKSRCFDPFPFPPPPPTNIYLQVTDLAERLDAHRKARLSQHADLTLTGMYNVLEKLKAGEPLDAKEQAIHQKALTSILLELHTQLDRVVFDAYGWPTDLDDEGILERVVRLNQERAAEEQRGLVRWLRPEFQNPQGATGAQQELVEGEDAVVVASGGAEKLVWPKGLPDQMRVVRDRLAQLGMGSTEQVCAGFVRAPRKDVAAILESLAALALALKLPDGWGAVR